MTHDVALNRLIDLRTTSQRSCGVSNEATGVRRREVFPATDGNAVLGPRSDGQSFVQKYAACNDKLDQVSKATGLRFEFGHNAVNFTTINRFQDAAAGIGQ